jgi:hypothetical protein
MAVTGIPDYIGALPIEYSLRCACARRYVIFTGNGPMIGNAISRAKERAEQMNAAFIDARSTPFMNCDCGQSLDFMPDDSMAVM